MASKKKWNPTGLSSDWKLFGNWNVKVLDSNNRWQLLHQVSALSMTAKATVAGETDVVHGIEGEHIVPEKRRITLRSSRFQTEFFEVRQSQPNKNIWD